MSFLSRTRLNIAALAVTALSAGLLTGCDGLVPTAPAGNSFASQGVLQGKLHGGNQPITGATIKLYAAGNSGYGSTAVLYATTSSSLTDGAAGFSFHQTSNPGATGPSAPATDTYSCPVASTTNPDPQMYIVTSGGNTQGVGNGANSAAVFAVAIGNCSTAASAFVDVNEVTSLATMTALQQYFNPITESFGYPNTPQAVQGFVNAVSVIPRMANIAGGYALENSAVTTTPAGSSNQVTVVVTPETSKINTIANILAACVNTTSNTSPQCMTLFDSALPPDPSVTSQPGNDYSAIVDSSEDTLQALYFMLTNPTSGLSKVNMNNLFNLSSPSAPFQPTLDTAPTDWTIALSYTSSSACTLVSGAGTTSTGKFLSGINAPAVDAQGNLWGTAIGAAGNLYAISPSGTPLSCGLGTLASTAIIPVIDPAGNVWVGSTVKVSSLYHFYKWNAAGGTLDSTWTVPSNVGKPLSVTADGNNNIFYSASPNTSTFDTTSGTVNEFAGAGVSGVSPSGSQEIAGNIYDSPIWMQVDSADRIWVAISVQGTPTSQGFFSVYPSNDTSGTSYLAGTSDGAHTGFENSNFATSAVYNPYGVAVGVSGGVEKIFTGNGAGSGGSGQSYKWETITPSDTPGEVTSIINSPVNLAGMDSTRGVAVDGASNVWAANNNGATGNWVTGATTSGQFSVSEISAAGTALSATSATGTGVYGTNLGGFQKDSSFLAFGARGIAVDPSGNIWIGQNSSAATRLVMLVGAGVPAVTPLSVAAGSGKLGQMP